MEGSDLAGSDDRTLEERSAGAPRPPGRDEPAPADISVPGHEPGDAQPDIFVQPPLTQGRPWIWSSAIGLLVIAAMLAGILFITFREGLAQFWPCAIVEIRLKDGGTVLGEVRNRETARIPGKATPVKRRLVQVGHREVTGSADFVWIDEDAAASESAPRDAWVIERVEYGNLYGRLVRVEGAQSLEEALDRGAHIQDQLEQVRSRMNATREKAALTSLEKRRAELEREGKSIVMIWSLSDGSEKATPAGTVVSAFAPNSLGFFGRLGRFLSRAWSFLTESPRESNSEGGIWPVIMGTLFLVITMTLAAVPMGVMMAIYLNEYAHDGPMLRLVRLAMANLAGVPSIVFGIFGLGLFVYTIGGGLDGAFYGERGHPTWGTGGVLWGALTLALLTIPVVVVAAGEGFQSVPRAHRDGALALGATRWQTIRRVVLPQALPGILTGMILAVGRGAGEVAPLMVLGAAVKLAPQPIFDSAFPFFHLDRKFTHLGFHIYDVSMQSPNVEAAKPMTYSSTLVLIALVLLLNFAAIVLRARLRKRFRGAAL